VSILAWIILGLFAGFIASRFLTGAGAGLGPNLVIGVVGALVGGGIFQFAGETGITGFNLWSLFVAIIGSVVVLALYHVLTGRKVRV
jgi:uncharacterized membrane protein YeaQ/YmgE (transglycosylase-associated protein family)